MMDKNDRELIELAAKAAGIVLGGETDTGFAIEISTKPYAATWSPLDDDGDALRLAARIGIWIEQWPDEDGEGAYCSTSDRIIEHHKSDASAATRRAIVRAAAEIGKQIEVK